jgi:hypothetical protein
VKALRLSALVFEKLKQQQPHQNQRDAVAANCPKVN